VYGGKWIRSNEGKDGSEISKFAGSKVDALLKMGFSKVVLPIDHGIRHKGTLSYMENSLRAICCSETKSDSSTKQVQWKLTKMEEVPLWVASNSPEMEVEYEQEKRGGNVVQSLNYIVSPDKRQPDLCSNGPTQPCVEILNSEQLQRHLNAVSQHPALVSPLNKEMWDAINISQYEFVTFSTASSLAGGDSSQ